MKLKYKDIPRIKAKLLIKQDYLCPICLRDFRKMPSKEICLDHNHNNGKVRAVLCRGCNSMEGKVRRLFIRVGLQKRFVNYSEFLEALSLYTYYPETNYIHPKFKVKNVKQK